MLALWWRCYGEREGERVWLSYCSQAVNARSSKGSFGEDCAETFEYVKIAMDDYKEDSTHEH